MSDHPLAAALAAIRERERLSREQGHLRSLEDIQRLLKAVEAVRAIHRPDGEMCVDAIWCACCGIEIDWPCPTLAAVERELNRRHR
jgi:hypothetical protein